MIYLEHFNRLNEGVESWNKWRSDNPHIQPILLDVDLSLRNLNGINFSNALLERTDLMGTQLIQANLQGARLRNANLCGVEHFHPTDTINTQRYQTCNLSDADLTDADLTNADLTDAELSNAKLVRANLTKAELNGAYFNNANLQGANLSLARVIYTSFINADLTGACIQNWQYSSDTKFYEVSCKYIYYGIEYDSISQSWKFKDRIPHNPEIHFKDGEFEKFIQKAQNTVDLIFTNGIDWQAFLQAFLKLKSETGDELSIYSVEDKWDNYFVVSINVPPDTNKGKLAEALNREYELKEDKKFLQQHITDLTMSLKEALRKQPMSGDTFNINATNSPVSIAKDNATQYIHIISEIFEQHQDISEITSEIHKLLTQVQSQGLSESDAQEKVADDLANKAKSDSTMMEKLKSLGTSFGSASGKALVTEVVKAVFKLALEKAGIHLE